MGFVSPRGNRQMSDAGERSSERNFSTADGAIDTLCSVIRVLGSESFPLDGELDQNQFADSCTAFARHVENGAAVPDYDIDATEIGKREWSTVQRFLVERRRHEKKFVTEHLSGYRGMVDDLVSGLRQIGLKDQDTQTRVQNCLLSLHEAIGRETTSNNGLPMLRTALTQTISEVNDTFSEQKSFYETQLKELNDRMASLRQDLVAVREEMKRDPLTQAFNRRAFDSGISHSLNMHFFSGQPVTLLMVDLDDFKRVNDGYGHAAGDAVLRAVGECLARSFIRKNDLVARYGGDEFAVILEDTAKKDVVMLVERFLERVREIEVESHGDIIKISCSVGFTSAVQEDTIESFVGRADKALFNAKHQGRDQSGLL